MLNQMREYQCRKLTRINTKLLLVLETFKATCICICFKLAKILYPNKKPEVKEKEIFKYWLFSLLRAAVFFPSRPFC